MSKPILVIIAKSWGEFEYKKKKVMATLGFS